LKKIIGIFIVTLLIFVIFFPLITNGLNLNNNQPFISIQNSKDFINTQKQDENEDWTFTVKENPVTFNYLEKPCCIEMDDGWQENADFDPCIKRGDLPEKFSWLELNGCTPIKNQNPWGTCWAFSVVAPLECNIKIKDGNTVDLSEQWLVSCSHEDAYNFCAHYYHLREPVYRPIYEWHMRTDYCGESGAVLETDCPYSYSQDSYDISCDCPYVHPYMIESFAFIGFVDDVVPDTDAIKQAILDYGPLSACVWVGDDFIYYNSGVFNKNLMTGGGHAVAIVGWDDTQGENGIWIIRNSWGEAWGENGYMRIEYGCSKIGRAACYVNYPGIDFPKDILSLPVGIISNNNELRHPWEMVNVLDLNPDEPGIQQKIMVYPNKDVQIEYIGRFQKDPQLRSTLNQIFATYSWNTNWPPLDVYPLYSDIPPREGEYYSDSWIVQAPSEDGEYSIWICGNQTDEMYQAVDNFNNKPDVQPHGKIIVMENQSRIECNGILSWNDIKPGEIITNNFTISNIGDSFTNLDWEIESFPDWGTWTFIPSNGSGLTPESEFTTVKVTVVAPNDKKKSFTGVVKIINTNIFDDYGTIQVSLTTPKIKTKDNFNPWIFRLIQRFPILEFLL